jgi:hypothetical protein
MPVVSFHAGEEGGSLDSRIQVFGAPFNVHSSILKKLPYFSKTFIEKEGERSQEAAGGKSATGIKYFWHSEIEDGEIEAREGKWASPRKWKLVEKEATVICHKAAVLGLPWSNKVEADELTNSRRATSIDFQQIARIFQL